MGCHWIIGRPTIAVTLLALAAPVSADHVVLQNGREFDGEVVAESDRTLTLEMFVPPGYTLGRTFEKAAIKTLVRPPREGEPYVLVPLIGQIGKDVTADALRGGLEKARKANPRFIVLAIDSPGGDIGEMVGMLDLLRDASKQIEVVAYVKRAYSAAAVIAMSCRDIYMKPDAAIGATVPFRMTANGPADVDAKFRSVIEAQMRASTAQGGHADLLIRAMSEMNLELYLASENGKPVLRTSGPGKLIKSKGQILTLTANEAAECGLAHVVAGMTEMGKQVAGGAWYEASRRPWNAVIAAVALQRQRERDLMEQEQRWLARQTAMAQIRPEYEAIVRRVAELSTKINAARNAIEESTKRSTAELKQIDADYRQAIASARFQSDAVAAAARAAEMRDSRAAATRQNWQSQVASFQAQEDAAQKELAQLRIRAQQLLDSLPPE